MNDILIKEDISSMIYEVEDNYVILDSEISATKCYGYIYDKIITYYDIGNSISMFKLFYMIGVRI